MKIHVAIAIGLLGGLLLGLAAALTQSSALLAVAQGLEPVGTAFTNLLKMAVIPLVAAALFVGVAKLGDLKSVGRLGGLTLFFFAATSLVSILIGMGVMRLMLPLADEAAAQAAAPAAAAAPMLPGPIDFLLNLIPSNPFQAASEGALLPLIFFTMLFAAATGTLSSEHRDRLLGFASSITEALIKLVHWILWTAPVGVFALAAPVTARSGWAMLQSLLAFVLAVIIGLIIFVALVYLPVVKLLSRVTPLAFLRACVGPQMIAFTTTSSVATIPAMLDAADRELALSRSVASFVIPLGAAIGRAGSALFQGAAIVFLAWLYGVSIPVAGVGGAVLATFLVSLTVASVPSASVVTLAPALQTLGIPLAGMTVLLGVDRIPDMFRTATNVTGHVTAAVVLDETHG